MMKSILNRTPCCIHLTEAHTDIKHTPIHATNLIYQQHSFQLRMIYTGIDLFEPN